MPQNLETADGVRQIVKQNEELTVENLKLRDRVEALLIKTGPLESEARRLKEIEESVKGFIEAATKISGRKESTDEFFNVNTAAKAIQSLTDAVRVKLSGLEFKISNLEKDLIQAKNDAASVKSQRDGYYDMLRAARNAIEAAQGGTFNWRVSVVDWLKIELPEIVKKSRSYADPTEKRKLQAEIDRLKEELQVADSKLQYSEIEVDSLNRTLDGVADTLRSAAELIELRNEDVDDFFLVEEVDEKDDGDSFVTDPFDFDYNDSGI